MCMCILCTVLYTWQLTTRTWVPNQDTHFISKNTTHFSFLVGWLVNPSPLILLLVSGVDDQEEDHAGGDEQGHYDTHWPGEYPPGCGGRAWSGREGGISFYSSRHLVYKRISPNSIKSSDGLKVLMFAYPISQELTRLGTNSVNIVWTSPHWLSFILTTNVFLVIWWSLIINAKIQTFKDVAWINDTLMLVSFFLWYLTDHTDKQA